MLSSKEIFFFKLLNHIRNRDTDVENKPMDTKGESGGVGGGRVMNWEIGIDMYTLICIK